MDNFREQLKDLTTTPSRDGQIMRMNKLNDEFARSLKSLEMGANNYNCFMYALGVEGDEDVKDILSANPQIKFGSSYITKLIDTEVLVEDIHGSVVLYFNGDKPLHAARRLHNGLCISKWGMGLLWQHELYDLPLNYGDRHAFFNLSSSAAAVEAFKKYSQKH